MMRVLCLDIEGGYGGSSRSLFYLLKYLDHARVAPEVWCKRQGPIVEEYANLGIPCRVCPDMPKFTSVPRLSRNLYLLAQGLLDFRRASEFREELAQVARSRFDLVHFNHEGLYCLARWLRKAAPAALTMHVRTRPPQSPFARFQARTIGRSVDRLVFITENERRHFEALGGRCPGETIFNVVEPGGDACAPLPEIPADGRFNVASISNFSHTRGVHLLVDVALELAALGRRDIRFVVAGKMDVPRSFPGAIGRHARLGGRFEDYVAGLGLGDMFLFLGHVARPEAVLAACPALIKLELGLCPWSRDILEAMAFGRVVLTVGSDETFVTHQETGILLPGFDAAGLARELAALADDPERVARLGRVAGDRVAALCHGPDQARALERCWRLALEARGSRGGA